MIEFLKQVAAITSISDIFITDRKSPFENAQRCIIYVGYSPHIALGVSVNMLLTTDH